MLWSTRAVRYRMPQKDSMTDAVPLEKVSVTIQLNRTRTPFGAQQNQGRKHDRRNPRTIGVLVSEHPRQRTTTLQNKATKSSSDLPLPPLELVRSYAGQLMGLMATMRRDAAIRALRLELPTDTPDSPVHAAALIEACDAVGHRPAHAPPQSQEPVFKAKPATE